MLLLKLVVGIILLLGGFIYMYKPNLVMQLNKFARENIFSDRIVLLERKKLAILLFCTAFIFIYMGIESIDENILVKENSSQLIDSEQIILYHAMKDYNKGNYDNALNNYRKILAIHPSNTNVLRKMARTYVKMQFPKKAIIIYENILRLDPSNQEIRAEIARLHEIKGQNANKRNH